MAILQRLTIKNRMVAKVTESVCGLKKVLIMVLMVNFLIGLVSLKVNAQTLKPQIEDLSKIKVDELSDGQIQQFKEKFQREGYAISEVENELAKRNMPEAEIKKLIQRLSFLENEIKNNNENENSESGDFFGTDRNLNSKEKGDAKTEDLFVLLRPKIFGSELFNNPRLSFEPNLKMATPLNYQLGPDDEVIIDIFGFSEQSYKLKVRPEGNVRIPNLGPVQVAGLTVEQAQAKIKTQLVTLYPRIASGETKVAVNLGSIRSIKVTILGEVNAPGTYTLPSVATVFNALYASGGPNSNGSFRKIQLIRGNKVLVKIDMYDFLLNGNAKGNVPLKDQDVIKVEAFEKRVEIKGFVKRDGFFEATDKDNLLTLITYAGGFAPNAFNEQIKVTRNTGLQRKVLDVKNAEFKSFLPANGDVYFIDSILSRYENRIEISGSVFRPGFFSLENNNKLSLLLKNSGGAKEDAFMTRATILRRMEDNSQELISVNLLEILSGKVDLELKREDKVTVASKSEMKEDYFVTINGAVKNPGKYPFAYNMYVEDLIILAGGLLESASLDNIQIARRLEDADKLNKNSELAKIISLEIQKDLKTTKDNNLTLANFDNVTVFIKPGYIKQKQVEIKGEVIFPGIYSIQKGNERISDLVKRAGGITAIGYAGGAILVRKRANSFQNEIMMENKINALRKQSKDTLKVAKLIKEELEKNIDVVGIDLMRILNRPGSKEDVILAEGDILEIPSLNQTVLVNGEVLYPVRLSFDPSKSYKEYVSNAGGYSVNSLKRRSYIVYPNGTAKDTKSFLGIKKYPKVLPGSELVVPPKEEKRSLSALEVITIATSLTSMLVLLTTLIQ